MQYFRLVIIYTQGLQSFVQSRSIQKYTLQNNILEDYVKQYIYINENLYLQINNHKVININVLTLSSPVGGGKSERFQQLNERKIHFLIRK